MIFSKIWGTTQLIFCNSNVEVHRIEVLKGAYCSKHFHQFKYNGFFLESGSLNIEIYRKDAKVTDITTLKPMGYTIVEPLVDHRFLALENSIAYEFYWTELKTEDIVRLTVGGKND